MKGNRPSATGGEPDGRRKVSRTIIILGMHRSGTSALTGALEQCGLYLGDVQRNRGDNPKGWCEPRAVNSLQEDLFRVHGGRWVAPPEQVVWTPKHKASRDRFISSFEGQPIWGFKDPRTLFTLDGWLEALPDAELVGIYRRPNLVAESLSRRNQLSLRAGLAAWLKFNQRLLRWHRSRPFPLISFDDHPVPFRRQLAKLTASLGLIQAPGNETVLRRTVSAHVRLASGHFTHGGHGNLHSAGAASWRPHGFPHGLISDPLHSAGAERPC